MVDRESTVPVRSLPPGEQLPARPLHVTIVAKDGSAGYGGLSSVVRHLRVHLPREVSVAEVVRSSDGRPQAPCGMIRGPFTVVPGPAGPIAVLPCSVPSSLALRLAGRLRHHRGASWTLPLLVSVAEGGPLTSAVTTGTDVVHVVGNGFEGLGLAAGRMARRISAPLTVWPAIHPGRWGDSHLDAQLYRRADVVFCQSEHEQRLVVQLGVDQDRTVVSPLGPFDGPHGDGERFRSHHGLVGRPIVLFLARRDRYKGLEVLVDSFTDIRAAVPDAVLIVAGPLGDAPALPIDPAWCIDLGSVSSADAADAIASANVVCVPSVAESLGIVVLDAWSRAVPVVVGPSPASQELVRNGGGISVSQSAEEVTSAILRLLQNPDEARSMGLAGQAIQRSRYTWANTVALHVAVWAALVR